MKDLREEALKEYEELEAMMLEDDLIMDIMPDVVYDKMMEAQQKRNKAMNLITDGYGSNFPNF